MLVGRRDARPTRQLLELGHHQHLGVIKLLGPPARLAHGVGLDVIERVGWRGDPVCGRGSVATRTHQQQPQQTVRGLSRGRLGAV